MSCKRLISTFSFIVLSCVTISSCATRPPIEDSPPINATTDSKEPQSGLSITLNSTQIAGGSLLVVNAVSTNPMDQDGSIAVLGDLTAPFFKNTSKDPSHFQAILAIPYTQAPGEMRLEVIPRNDRTLTQTLNLTVTSTNHPVERIRVSRRYTSRRQRSVASLHDPARTSSPVFQQLTLHKYWDGPFQLPVNTRITSPFGTQRTFNRKLQTFHGGVDFHAPIGTPIHAAASGVVVLSRRLFATGNTVIIDHGYGIFTVYAHLSRRKVKTGALVPEGSTVGLSGKTGRVHGAHFHWGTVVRGIKVDSMDLLKILSCNWSNSGGSV